MSKKLSVEEALRQKMNELPLPDENESWQNMKALLDEKEKRKPFVFFRNEKIIGSAILLSLLCLWLIISPEKTMKQTAGADAKNRAMQKQDFRQGQAAEAVSDNKIKEKKTAKQKDSSVAMQTYNPVAVSSSAQAAGTNTNALSQSRLSFTENKQTAIQKKQDAVRKNNAFSTQLHKTRLPGKNVLQSDVFNKRMDNSTIQLTDSSETVHKRNDENDSQQSPADIDSSNLSSSTHADSNHHITSLLKDSLQQTTGKAVSTAKAAIVIRRRNAYFVDAGIGLKQQLPVGGQQFISRNYNGNKTILTDYIPALYIKLEKEKRWFLQGGFQYVSPRLINGFTYYQKTKTDYSHSNITMIVYQLQKTWYTEVPVSFNLYVRPSWSVGAGAVYNRLRGAVANRETVVNDALSGKQLTATEPLAIKGFTDSFLYKTQTGLLLQTDYQTNRWSFGLRYMQDIQPFITYTLPDGRQKDKRNTSLELMIQYRLFRSSKFMLNKH